MTNVFVFGNPDLDFDSLPLRILPMLRKKFPKIRFEIKDPNEEWDFKDDCIIVDTVQGIKKVSVFSDLKSFSASPRVTMHDLDALTNLRLLDKLGKLKKIKIIGIPPMIAEKDALHSVLLILQSILLSENARHSSCKGRMHG